MTPEEHKALHIKLHNALDELFADYIGHHPEQTLFLQMPVITLINWSHEQTISPSEPGHVGDPKHG
jgi:hypothetical protein